MSRSNKRFTIQQVECPENIKVEPVPSECAREAVDLTLQVSSPPGDETEATVVLHTEPRGTVEVLVKYRDVRPVVSVIGPKRSRTTDEN